MLNKTDAAPDPMDSPSLQAAPRLAATWAGLEEFGIPTNRDRGGKVLFGARPLLSRPQ